MTSPQRFRATYAFQPTDRMVRKEFGIWPEAIERWKQEGLPQDWQERNFFQFDKPWGEAVPLNLGWCEPPFYPAYEDKVVRREGPYEVVQDVAGRLLRVFEGRRHGFMPQYIRHPVTGWRDWEEEAAPRLDPATEERYARLGEALPRLRERQAREGWFLTLRVIGAYMYLRALVGPEDLLYAFHDQPDLLHAMMERWEALALEALARVQPVLELDQIAFGEDICYKSGPLISPRMIEEFLMPHYARVITTARARQQRHVYVYVDTDGYAPPVIPLYLKVGMDVFMPLEVAAGCDVVAIGRQYPELVLEGGIDKRVLAAGKDDIDRYLAAVIPPMRERGGYIPMCDHGVPDNVSFENYLHYRRRICDMDSR